MALGKTLQDARLQRRMTTSQVAAATMMKIQMIDAIEREDFSKVSAPIYGKGFIRLFAECVGLDPKPLVDEYMEQYAPKKKPSLVSEGHRPAIISEPAGEVSADADVSPAKETAAVGGQGDLFAEKTGMEGASPTPPRVAIADETSLGATTRTGGEAAGSPIGSLEDTLWKPKEASDDKLWAMDRDSIEAEPNPFKNRSAISIVKRLSIALGVIVLLIFVVSGLSRLARKDASEAGKTPAAAQQTPQKLRVAADPPQPYID